MAIKDILRKAAGKTYVTFRKHGPAICTVVGCVCVAGTGVLAFMGGMKADEILDKMPEDSTTVDKVKATWKAWVPPVAVGAVGVGAIILGNGLSRRQISALITTSAMNAAAITRTGEEVNERMKEIKNAEADALKEERALANKEERWRSIFENDCDMDIVCLDPDGDIYYDDWTGIFFRQKRDIVEKAYYTFNKLYQERTRAELSLLYKLFGFENRNNKWDPGHIPSSFNDIGWEIYTAFDPEIDGIDTIDEHSCTGESWIDFREINDGKSRIFGSTISDVDWKPLDDITKITYVFAPHALYTPYMSEKEADEYCYNMSFSGNRRYEDLYRRFTA